MQIRMNLQKHDRHLTGIIMYNRRNRSWLRLFPDMYLQSGKRNEGIIMDTAL